MSLPFSLARYSIIANISAVIARNAKNTTTGFRNTMNIRKPLAMPSKSDTQVPKNPSPDLSGGADAEYNITAEEK